MYVLYVMAVFLRLKDDFVCTLAEALHKNTHVTNVDLSSNGQSVSHSFTQSVSQFHCSFNLISASDRLSVSVCLCVCVLLDDIVCVSDIALAVQRSLQSE